MHYNTQHAPQSRKHQAGKRGECGARDRRGEIEGTQKEEEKEVQSGEKKNKKKEECEK